MLWGLSCLVSGGILEYCVHAIPHVLRGVHEVYIILRAHEVYIILRVSYYLLEASAQWCLTRQEVLPYPHIGPGSLAGLSTARSQDSGRWSRVTLARPKFRANRTL